MNETVQRGKNEKALLRGLVILKFCFPGYIKIYNEFLYILTKLQINFIIVDKVSHI